MDKRYFQEIFERYYNPLTNYSFKTLKDTDLAKDVVQEVFMKIWNDKIPLIKGQEGLLLFKMVRNRSIDEIRKMKALNRVDMPHEMTDSEVTEEHDVYMLKELIISLVRQLPPKCGEIFRLTKINGLSCSEVAETLGISQKTVENQMTIAYRKLRELMKKNMDN